jgi:hypothetical protein
MKPPNPKLVLASLLGACIFACNQPSETDATAQDPGSLPETGSGFEKSALAIKAGNYSQQEKIAAMEALASRYGHIVAPQAIPDPDPALPAGEIPEGGALGKAAAIRYSVMKMQFFKKDFVPTISIRVNVNQTLTAFTARDPNGTVDPFLVGTYNVAANGGFANLVKVVGLNDDDGSSLDSRFTWKNQTGIARWVDIIAFAYTPALGGVVSVRASVDGGERIGPTLYMGGTAIYENNFSSVPPPGCLGGPSAERLTLHTTTQGGYNNGVLMVNSQTMTGALLYNQGAKTDASIDLPTPTPSGYPNFMLVFTTYWGELGSGIAGLYSAHQSQQYSCFF